MASRNEKGVRDIYRRSVAMGVKARRSINVPDTNGTYFKLEAPVFVIPAKAGIHFLFELAASTQWIPAFAGMTVRVDVFMPWQALRLE